MPLQPVVTEVERLLFRSDIAAAGAFRCRATHGLFTESNPTSGHLFVFPRSSTKILYAGGRTVTATPAVTMFYNEGQEFRRERIDDADSCDWFMVAEDVVRDIVGRYDRSAAGREKIFHFTSGRASGKLYLRQRRVHQQLVSGTIADPLDADEAIMHLLNTAVRDACGARPRPVQPTPAERHDVVEKVMELMAARPAANPRLRDLALVANCSPYHLCRIFRDATGSTITEYKHALRLHIALGALRRRSRDISDLALSLGYASHSHFTLYFRRHFGMTPTEYRSAIA